MCLKYIFNSLKLDKFYVNGIVLMKKIQLFEEAYYSQQIELFINTNYDYYGIDLDEFLAESPESYYDQLFDRISLIKQKLYTKLLRNQQQVNLKSKPGHLVIPSRIKTWTALGEFLMKLNESDEFNFQVPLDIEIEKEIVLEKAIKPIEAEKKLDVRPEVDEEKSILLNNLFFIFSVDECVIKLGKISL